MSGDYKSESLRFFTQLRASLDRTVADKEAELHQAASAVAAAQAEAAAQEELAELAKGELAEYQRRMAAEVNHARTEALKSVEGNFGGPYLRPMLIHCCFLSCHIYLSRVFHAISHQGQLYFLPEMLLCPALRVLVMPVQVTESIYRQSVEKLLSFWKIHTLNPIKTGLLNAHVPCRQGQAYWRADKAADAVSQEQAGT